MQHQPDWDTRFLDLFTRCAEDYRSGETNREALFTPEDIAFLRSIGHKPFEVFDYVEDHARYDQPAAGTVLLVAAVRRTYFLEVQDGVPSDHEISPDELPAKDAELDGVSWLPRIIAKASAKLRGELHPDIMFGCPGDMEFLQRHGVHPADFLRLVWREEARPDVIRRELGDGSAS